MAKLPKKSTMIETINRVRGYIQKLLLSDKMSLKDFNTTEQALCKLIKIIKK